MKRLDQIRKDFGNALGALVEAVQQAQSDLEIDGAIQRFEFTFELFWKLLKAYLEHKGVLVRTPRDAFKEAFGIGVIDDEPVCLQMLDDRNTSVHMYDQRISREIFQRIGKDYVKLFKSVLDRIKL